MILEKIELQGFGSYLNYNSVSIPKGLCGIVGRYESNKEKSIGSGKSTLVMAILYALFGAGEFTILDELLNDKLAPKSKFFVRLTFTQNGVNYVVERGRKPESYLDVFANGVPFEGTTIAKRSEAIINLVGMDYDLFTASVFFEQDRLSKLVDVESSQRRMYVEKVLGINYWTSAHQDCLSEYNQQIKSSEEISKHLLTLKSDIESKEQKVLELDAVTKEIDDKTSLLHNYKSELNQYINLIEKKKELDGLNVRYQELVRSLEHQKQVLATYVTSISEKTTKLSEEVASLDKTLLLLEESRKVAANLELQVSTNREELGNKTQNFHTVEIQISKNATELKFLEEKKSALKAGICDSCYQVISESHSQLKHSEFAEKIEALQRTTAELQQHYLEIQQEKDQLQKSLETISTQLTQELLKIKGVEQNTTLLKISVERLKQEIEFLNTQVTTSERKIQEDEILKTNYEDKIHALEKEITHNVDISSITHLRSEIEQLESELSSLEFKRGALTQLKEQFLAEKGHYEKRKQELDNIELQKKRLSFVIQGFKEISASIFETSVNSIEYEASKIIHQFIPEMNIIVYENKTKSRKTLEIAFEIDGKRRSYSRLSGGQKTIANLALRLGFSKVISSRVGANIEFLVLDEPFGYLDSYNRDLVKSVLCHLNTWFKQILVISHIDNVQEFPNLIHVVMDENHVSRVEV